MVFNRYDGGSVKNPLLKDSNPIVGIELGNERLENPGDRTNCSFKLQNGEAIQAQIVIGDQKAYQVRFKTQAEAEKALAWIKDEVVPNSSLARNEAERIQKHSRVTPPPRNISDGSYLFRLVGDAQFNALKQASISENKESRNLLDLG